MFKNLPYFKSNVGTDLLDGFDNFFRGWFDDEAVMRTDVQEKDGSIVLDIELPGCEKENIGLSVDNGYLLVSAKKCEETADEKKGRYLHRERRCGSFSRSFFVGDIKEEDIKASFKNGVLAISFPKEAAKKVESKKVITIE